MGKNLQKKLELVKFLLDFLQERKDNFGKDFLGEVIFVIHYYWTLWQTEESYQEQRNSEEKDGKFFDLNDTLHLKLQHSLVLSVYSSVPFEMRRESSIARVSVVSSFPVIEILLSSI